MEKITQERLNNLAKTINKAAGTPLEYGKKGNYHAGQLFGLRWVLGQNSNGAGGATREILNAPSKSALYELMHAYLAGIQSTK